MTEYLELAKEVVKRASANGAEAEAIITQDSETQIKLSKGEVEQLSQASARGLGVRVIDGAVQVMPIPPTFPMRASSRPGAQH